MSQKGRKIFLFVSILAGILSASLGFETREVNEMGWVLFFTGIVFTAVAAIILGRLFVVSPSERPFPNRALLIPAFGFLAIMVVAPVDYFFMVRIIPHTDQIHHIGLIVFAIGICVYLLLTSLEKMRGLRSMASQPLLLRWIIRPIFISMILCSFGIGIGYSSILGLGLTFLVIIPGLIARMRFEDQTHETIK